MDQSAMKGPGMSTQAIYKITVQGKLPDNWNDWFNGSLISTQSGMGGESHTAITCRVRDQAELLGFLNRLNSINLPLLQVSYIQSEQR
jgi:hypothetical protein